MYKYNHALFKQLFKQFIIFWETSYLKLVSIFIGTSKTAHRFRASTEIQNKTYVYRTVASSNTFRLEAHAGFFRLLMKGIFDP